MPEANEANEALLADIGARLDAHFAPAIPEAWIVALVAELTARDAATAE